MQDNANEFLHWKRKTILFLTGQTISLFGSALVQFAIVWYVARTTNSGVMVTISTVCGFLPQILVSLFAGVWADRYSRKLMILLADGGIALATLVLVLALFMMSGYREMGLIFLISAIRSLGAGIQSPAVSALIPQIVPQDRLLKVNGLNGSVQSLVFFVAPAVGGAVLENAEFHNVLFIDLATAVVGIGILLALPIPVHAKASEAQTTDIFSDLREGVRYAFANRFVRKLLRFFMICSVLFVPAAFLNVLMVTRVFGEGYWYLTLNEMAFFAGTMLGGFAIAAWGGFKNRLMTLAFSCVVFGVTTVGLGVANNFYVYLSIMTVTGFAMPMFDAPVMSLLQEKVEMDMQGRVFSLVQIVFALMMPLGMTVFGPLADVVPIEWLMVASGLLLVALGASLPLDRDFMKEGLPFRKAER